MAFSCKYYFVVIVVIGVFLNVSSSEKKKNGVFTKYNPTYEDLAKQTNHHLFSGDSHLVRTSRIHGKKAVPKNENLNFKQKRDYSSQVLDNPYSEQEFVKSQETSSIVGPMLLRYVDGSGSIDSSIHPLYTSDIGASDKLNPDNVFYRSDNLALYSSLLSYTASNNCGSAYRICSKNGNTKKSNSKRCLCEEKCKEYGNCCFDYPLGQIDENTKKFRRWSCMEVREGIAYFAISTCPEDWTNQYVRFQCEVNDYNNSDSFRKIPASSMDTRLTYSNLYCAICNNDLNITFWSMGLDCPKSVNLHVDTLQRTDINECEISFSVPKFENYFTKLPLKKCDAGLISECSEAWKIKNFKNMSYVTDISTKCSLIYAPVKGIFFLRTIQYKNKFCAECNGVEKANSLCPINIHLSKPNIVHPALSLLLDIDFINGGSIVGSEERCPTMHLYDPWQKQCRNVLCSWQYKYEDGKCVLNPEAIHDVTKPNGSLDSKFNSSLQSDCLRTKFSAKEISLLENGTLIILRGKLTFSLNEYERDDNGSILVCVPDFMESKYVSTFTDVQGNLTLVGIGVSLLSLLLKIGFSLFTVEKRKLPSKIVLFLSITLFFAQLLFLFGIYRTEFPVLCTVVGILLHYCFLSTFFWMNVLAYDIWKTFASSDSMTRPYLISKQLFRYCLYGWLVPLSIVFIAVLANWYFNYPLLNPEYGKTVCWFSNKVALAVFFGAPLAILLLVNVVFFVVTANEIRKTTNATKFVVENSNNGRDRAQFGLYCKLACIMGMTWFFGFAAAYSGSTTLWYLFIIFNSVQGVYVLIAFTHFHIPKWLRSKQLFYISSRNSAMSRSSLTFTTSLSRV